MKGGDANGSKYELDPNYGDFDQVYFRVFVEKRPKSPRQRRLWVKLERNIRAPRDFNLEGLFLSRIRTTAQ